VPRALPETTFSIFRVIFDSFGSTRSRSDATGRAYRLVGFTEGARSEGRYWAASTTRHPGPSSILRRSSAANYSQLQVGLVMVPVVPPRRFQRPTSDPQRLCETPHVTASSDLQLLLYLGTSVRGEDAASRRCGETVCNITSNTKEGSGGDAGRK
jgi:hypothetical protein